MHAESVCEEHKLARGEQEPELPDDVLVTEQELAPLPTVIIAPLIGWRTTAPDVCLTARIAMSSLRTFCARQGEAIINKINNFLTVCPLETPCPYVAD